MNVTSSPSTGDLRASRPFARFGVRITTWATRAHYARFSLALLFFLLIYPITSTWVLPTMLRSTLILTSAELALVTGLTFSASMTVRATYRTILLHGAERFNLPGAPPPSQLRLTPSLFYPVVLSAPIVGTAATLSMVEGGMDLLESRRGCHGRCCRRLARDVDDDRPPRPSHQPIRRTARLGNP